MPRSFRGIKNLLLHSQTSPKISALSIAIGVFLAFSPFVGLQFVIVMLIAKFSRLNPILLVAGILVHNPWTMIPIHLFGLATGDLLLNGTLNSLEQLAGLPWGDIGISIFWNADFWANQKQLILDIIAPFVVGSLFTACSIGLLSYYLALNIINKVGLYPLELSLPSKCPDQNEDTSE